MDLNEFQFIAESPDPRFDVIDKLQIRSRNIIKIQIRSLGIEELIVEMDTARLQEPYDSGVERLDGEELFSDEAIKGNKLMKAKSFDKLPKWL